MFFFLFGLIPFRLSYSQTLIAYNSEAEVGVSTNGGTSWTRHSSSTCYRLEGLACPTSSICYGANSGIHQLTTACRQSMGIVKTTDAFANIQFIDNYNPSSTKQVELTAIDCWSEMACIAVGTYFDSANPNAPEPGRVVRTTDGFATQTPSSTSDTLYDVSCPSANTCVAVGESSLIQYTTDGGVSWTTADTSNIDSFLQSGKSFNYISCVSDHCMAEASGQYALVSTDTGRTWRSISINQGETFSYIGCLRSSGCAWSVPNYEDVSCASTRFCVVAVDQHSRNNDKFPGGFCWTWDFGTTWKCKKIVGGIDGYYYMAFTNVHCWEEGKCALGAYNPVNRVVLLTWSSETSVTHQSVNMRDSGLATNLQFNFRVGGPKASGTQNSKFSGTNAGGMIRVSRGLFLLFLCSLLAN